MSTSKQKTAAAKEMNTHKQIPSNAPFVFGKMNYIITAVSLLVLVLGFVLMSGSDGNIYDTKRTTLAPIVVILGFCIGFVAIFYKEKPKDNSAE
jgi:FtsH-binding integral membrane protein